MAANKKCTRFCSFIRVSIALLWRCDCGPDDNESLAAGKNKRREKRGIE